MQRLTNIVIFFRGVKVKICQKKVDLSTVNNLKKIKVKMNLRNYTCCKSY